METNEIGQVISYEEYHPFGTSAYRTAKSDTDLSLKRYRFTNLMRLYYTGIIELLSGNAYRKYGNHYGRGYSILEWGGTKQNIKVYRK